MLSVNYNNKNIYTVNVSTKTIDQITDTMMRIIQFSLTLRIFYLGPVSKRGIYSSMNRSSSVITNLLTGIFQLSLNKYDDTMVFSGYSNRGWNVFRLNNPLDLDQVELKPTNYLQQKTLRKAKSLLTFGRTNGGAENFNETDYSRHIFALEYESYNNQSNQSKNKRIIGQSL